MFIKLQKKDDRRALKYVQLYKATMSVIAKGHKFLLIYITFPVAQQAYKWLLNPFILHELFYQCRQSTLRSTPRGAAR